MALDKKLIIMAGPCAVESKAQIMQIAEKLKKLDVDFLRGGAYKPRTRPRMFQGLEEKGLEYLALAKAKTGMRIITECMGPEEIVKVAKVADIIQIGSRNMHNYDLLKKIAQRAPKKPILLKRGMQATKEEVLGAIEYLKKYGHNDEILVCERGIRTFANKEYDRFTLDAGFIADLKRDPNFKYNLIVDPSHPAGRADIVEDLAYAGIAAGADGLLIEVKKDNKTSPLSDGNQAITLKKLEEIIQKSKQIYSITHKKPQTEYVIKKAIHQELGKIPFHRNMPYLERLVFAEKSRISEQNRHIVAHNIDVPQGKIVPKYAQPHCHDVPEINIIMSQDPGGLEYKMVLGKDTKIVKSPAIVVIPAGMAHSAEAIRGKGIYFCARETSEHTGL
jgi:3-deoxy-7-phosphoheptulonate synthase